MSEKYTIAVIGAGGKMGMRVSNNLDKTEHTVAYVENSPAGRQRTIDAGRELTDAGAAVADADIVVFAVPDLALESVTADLVPQMKSGAIALTLDPAAAYAGLLTDRDDVIRAGAGNDYVYAGRGNDHLYGGLGSDRLYGGLGNDVLVDAHGKAVDALYGGDGNDTIYANFRDRIYAGAGNDRIVVAYPGAMKISCGTGDDTVTFNQPHPHVLLVGCEHVRVVSAG